MDPELQALLAKARAAMGQGKSVAHIDSVNKAHGAPAFADLVKMEQQAKAPKATPTSAAGPAVPVAKPPVGVGDVARSTGQGATLNWLDEMLGAFAAAPVGPAGYTPGHQEFNEPVRDAVRKADSTFQADHPVVDAVSRGVGSLIPGAVTAGALPGATTLPMLGRVGVSALTGGAMSGVASAGNAKDLDAKKIGTDAAVGAVAGATLSSLIEAAGTVAPGLGRAFMAYVSPTGAGKAAARRAISDAARKEGLSRAEFESIMGTLEDARPGLPVPADANVAFQRLLRGNVNEASGKVSDVITNVGARAEGTGARMAQDVRQLTGVGGVSTDAAQAEAKVAARAEAKKLYSPLEQKYATQTKSDPDLQAVLHNIDARPYWNRVKPESGKGAPGFVHYQQMKESLDDAIDKAFSHNPTEGKGPNFGVRLAEQRDKLVARMKEVFPEYKGVDNQYRQIMTVPSSYDDGAQAWAQKATAESVKEHLAALQTKAGDKADEAVKAYRHGLANPIIDELLKSRSKTEPSKFVWAKSKELTEQGKLARAAFPDDESFDKFIRGAIADRKFTETADAVSGNSTTAAQTQDMSKLPLSSSVANMLKTKVLNMTPQKATQTRANTISQLLAGRSTAEVADILGGRRAPVGAASITASGLAPNFTGLWDYLHRE